MGSTMPRAAPTSGLYLVFSAGGIRFAIPAVAVHEVCTAASLAERQRRQDLPVEDLAALFGVPAASPQGPNELGRGRAPPESCAGVVLDANPPRLFLVERVEEVRDLSRSGFFALPDQVRLAVQGTLRGARLDGNELLLELAPEALNTFVRRDRARPAELPVPPPLLRPPERALVYRAGEIRLAADLHVVGQVVPDPTVCPVPLLPDFLWGILHHARTLHVVLDASFPLGRGMRRPPALAVLVDIAGSPLAVAATRVEGVRTDFGRDVRCIPGGWLLSDGDGPIYLPAYDRLLVAA